MYIDGCVVKVASRCNLNCTYCYMYNKGDESYKLQPKVMSNEIVKTFIEKIKSYIDKYNKKYFVIVFHGGEPLLVGRKFYINFIKELEIVFGSNWSEIIYLSIQTNGVLLDNEWSLFLDQNKINIGISLDSTKESNDVQRVYHNGKSGYEDIILGYKTAMLTTGKVPGILSVMDITQNPKEVYKHYQSINAHLVDLLYPDNTYSDGVLDNLELGKWLVAIFDEWIKDDKNVVIRQYESLFSYLLGQGINNEYYGSFKPSTFILETNGEMQCNDAIRVCQDELSKNMFNILFHEIDQLIEAPSAYMYYNNHQLLCSQCKDCPIVDICGGGYYINRYSKDKGFDNPSIYCKSLTYLIVHIQNYLILELRKTNNELVKDVELINYDEVIAYHNTHKPIPNYFLQSFKSHA